MILRPLSFIYLLLLAAGCGNKQKPISATTQQELKEVNDTLEIKETDTLNINGYQLKFQPSAAVAIAGFNEQHGIKISGGQTAYFTSLENGIGLHLDNGDTLRLNNHPSEAHTYHFYSLLPAINSYLVRVQYPEGQSFLLVKKEDGQQVHLLGLPFVSPSKTYLVAVNEDQIAGHSPNALQFFERAGSFYRPIFTLHIKGWGTEKIKWLSDSAFAIERKTPLIDTARGKIDFAISYSTVQFQVTNSTTK